MDTVRLPTPEGIDAELVVDAGVTMHDRRRLLAAELVAARLGVERGRVHIKRDDPGVFGQHTRLFAQLDDAEEHLPLLISTSTFEPATVVGVSEPAVEVGFDIRSAEPDDETLAEIAAHFPLWPATDPRERLAHWSMVHAVLAADARGSRVHAEHVRLDPHSRRGWVPDRRIRYDLVDLSRDALLITLAYGRDPA